MTTKIGVSKNHKNNNKQILGECLSSQLQARKLINPAKKRILFNLMTITFHFKTMRILGLTLIPMKTIKDFLIFSRMISIHGENRIQTIISNNYKSKIHLDKMQLQDLKEKLILLILEDNMVKMQKTRLIHTIIKNKIRKTHLIRNQVEGLLSSNSQTKATSIQLMSQGTHKILINGVFP